MKEKKSFRKNTVIMRTQNIDAVDLNGEKVMMNIEKGKYFALNEVGSRIWDIIHGPTSVEDITNELINEYEVDNLVCEKAVVEFLQEMNDAELIVIG
jgi:hypothetical protein